MQAAVLQSDGSNMLMWTFAAWKVEVDRRQQLRDHFNKSHDYKNKSIEDDKNIRARRRNPRRKLHRYNIETREVDRPDNCFNALGIEPNSC